MAINFPDSPTTGDTHTVGDKTWTYDGTAWNVVQNNVADHGNLGGLADDDHTQYLLADGTRTATELTVGGDLTVDTSTLHVDSTNNRVGIGTTSPAEELDVVGDVQVSGRLGIGSGISAELDIKGASNPEIRLQSTDSSDPFLYFGDQVDAVRGGIGYDTSANALQLRGYNNSTRMTIDSSGNTSFTGYLAHPRAFFRAYRRGNQGWSLTGVQTIVFEYTVFNSGNNYSTTTGRFTAPVAGYYHLGAHFFKYTTYSNSTNTYWGIFTSNGYSTTTNHGTAGQDGGQSLSCIVYMSANDYADVQITSAGSTIQSYGTMSFNSFYGYLLSA